MPPVARSANAGDGSLAGVSRPPCTRALDHAVAILTGEQLRRLEHGTSDPRVVQALREANLEQEGR